MELSENNTITEDPIQCQDKVKWLDNNRNIKKFTEDDIGRITSNFSTCIGKGGFGEVYKGVLDDALVAVKKYIRDDLRKEFMEEVCIHSQINHNNVVKLIGYCIGKSTLTMVTEYVSNGNLHDLLHNSRISILLDMRLGIAIGVAEALSHMHLKHLSSGSLVCHGDVKSANILLDGNLTAKVSDLGASRLLLGGITRYTTRIKGSIDYMDPIYFQEGCLTPKSDVYSFGVVLLELIARTRVKQGNLIANFRNTKGNGQRALFDAEIVEENNINILKEMGKLANECLALEDIHRRPQMNDVAKRLRKLKKDLHAINNSVPILSSHHSWRRKYKDGTSMPTFFKRNPSNTKILSEFNKLRIFTQEELNDATHDYSYLLGGGTSAKIYKGTLEDNSVIAVKAFDALEGFKDAFINEGMIQSQIVHNNVIKLLGYCFGAGTPAFVYEYAAKGSLSDVLDGHEDFPLDLRVKIAIKTAESLEYLHSPETGIIRHGYVVPSKILLDDKFTPKLTGFSCARRLIKESKATAGDSVITNCHPSSGLYNGPIQDRFASLRVKIDVYQFGVLLLVLISRKNFIFYAEHHDLIIRFIAAYDTDNSGRAFFDRDITNEENITALEEIGKLALTCISSDIDERPTMKEVAERLRMIRRSWKEYMAEGDT